MFNLERLKKLTGFFLKILFVYCIVKLVINIIVNVILVVGIFTALSLLDIVFTDSLYVAVIIGVILGFLNLVKEFVDLFKQVDKE